jgi:LysR family transcriptional regulator, cell division regulator
MIPSPQEILGFIEIANSLNITKAAQRLGVTQPTLSQSLKKLEDTIGETLVIRSKTGVELTVAGKQLLRQARQLLDMWENLKSQTRSSTREVKGNVKIGCHPAVGLYSLPLFLPKLLSQHPELEITLFHDLSRKVFDKVINYEVEMGIVINPTEHPDIVLTKLLEDEVKIWKSKSAKVPNVLICHPELIQTQSILKKIKKADIQYDRVVTTNSLEIIANLTIQGAGYGIIPSRVVSIFDTEKTLRTIDESPVFKDQLYLAYRVENKNIEYIRAIKESIVNAF